MVYPRSYIEKRINEEKFRTCRTGSPFTLIFFNPFMLISNDSRSSKELSAHIPRIVDLETREIDIQGWWNKKTFAILLLDTSPDGGSVLIDKLISKIQSNGYNLTKSTPKAFFEMYTFPDNKPRKRYTKENKKGKVLEEAARNGTNPKHHIVNSPLRRPDPKFFTLNSSKRHYGVIKRGMDILLSGLLLVLLFPLFLLCALMIKLDSPGPVIYKQLRVGKGGRYFIFFKFRSMCHNADERVHENHIKNHVNQTDDLSCNGAPNENSYKIAHDERVTRVGRFLRKTSLDELPQLYNVLKGDMSLVGPRPHPVYEAELYNPWYRYRLDVKPGMTGLGQVEGRYNRKYEDVYRLDLRYVKSASLLLDLKILFKTPFTILSSRDAC